MSAKSLIPKSKAKTAYALLSEVKKLILEEPKRYDQNYELVIDRAANKTHTDAPECGTIGCVAGWVCVLTKGRDFNGDVMGAAGEILGLDYGAANQLFDWTAVPLRANVGTDQHAALGVKHIAKFQQKYAAQLKAKRV